MWKLPPFQYWRITWQNVTAIPNEWSPGAVWRLGRTFCSVEEARRKKPCDNDSACRKYTEKHEVGSGISGWGVKSRGWLSQGMGFLKQRACTRIQQHGIQIKEVKVFSHEEKFPVLTMHPSSHCSTTVEVRTGIQMKNWTSKKSVGREKKGNGQECRIFFFVKSHLLFWDGISHWTWNSQTS